MIILQPANNQSKKSNLNDGEFNGIKYSYMIPVDTSSNGIFTKIFLKLKSINKAILLIKREIDNSLNIKLLLLITDPFELIPFIRIAKKNEIKVFHETTEFPFIGMDSFLKKISLKIYLKIVNKFDGLFVITKAIAKYFEGIIAKERILHLPMTVEPERFDCSKHNKENNKFGRYIAYCGSMYTDKDGVPILIKAFNLFAEEHKEINLLLIGDNSNDELFRTISLEIKNSKYKNRIFLTGQVDRDWMPELLCNAEVLALARPNNIQAKGGFPTKLGEYLATGSPVAVTTVGEIPVYLNIDNAFLSEPDSFESFAETLVDIYRDTDKAKRIGMEGKRLSNTVFHYKVQSKKLKAFIFNA